MRVVSVNLDDQHRFSKLPAEEICLVEGIGVKGDAHAGRTVQHRSRVARNRAQPNLRQVHLLHSELFDAVAEKGYEVSPGDLGENLTTRGIELLALPTGAVLHLGDSARVTVTGLRNPCFQIDGFRRGLLKEVLRRDANGKLERLAGVMGVVSRGGVVRPGDSIEVVLPFPPHRPLKPV